MTIFTRLFGRVTESKADKLLRKTLQRTNKEYKPIEEIGLEIVRASTICRDEVKSLIQVPTEQDRLVPECLIFREFIFFFVHMLGRQASGQLSERRMRKFERYVLPVLASTVVDSYFADWPNNERGKMIDLFYSGLNEADLDYTKCAKLYLETSRGNSEANLLRAMFTRLALKIWPLFKREQSDLTIVMPRVMDVLIHAWGEMHLDKLIAEVKELG